MGYKISKSKTKYKNHLAFVEIPITKEEWIDLINADNDMTWFDNIGSGIEFYENFGKDAPKNVTAIYLYNEGEDCGILDINYMTTLSILNCEIVTQRKKCMEKIFEIADKLDAKVYKLGKEITKI
jgi:hypothetical protein